ncbi:MAG: hypothetical protein ACRDRI_10835 [Pseudonocardiaceae bacterium]
MTLLEPSVSSEETVDQQLRVIAATSRAVQRPGERLATVKHVGHAHHAQLRATGSPTPDSASPRPRLAAGHAAPHRVLPASSRIPA